MPDWHMPEWHLAGSRVLPDPEAVARAAADAIAAAITGAVAARGEAHVALAGGTTPQRAHALLAGRAELPWERVSLYFGDERCVPPDHPDSNHLAAAGSLLDPLAGRLDPARVHRMRGEDPDRDAAARDADADLPDRLDLLVLGLGPDGHTASLFPGSDALDEAVRRVVPVFGPKPPPWRLTITPPVIAAARAVLVLATGAAKADAARRALTDPFDPRATPAALARGGTWLLDAPAARLLPRSEIRT